MSAGLDHIVAPAALTERTGLKRGRTWMLITGDLVALATAYAIAYLVSAKIGSLPPVSAPGWFLVAVAATAPLVWVAVFTAYHLYENDHLQDLGLELRRAGGPLSRDARGLARLSDPVAGSQLLLRLVDLHRGRGGALPFRGTRARPDRARVDSQLDHPARDEAAADARRGQRPRGASRPAQDRSASRVRARARRLPRRRRPRDADADSRPTRPGCGDRRPVRHRPRPARVVRRQPRGDARPGPGRAAARRPGLDRAALLRDLHLALHARRHRGHAGRDAAADAPGAQRARAEALDGRARLRSGAAPAVRPCSRAIATA